MRNICQRHVLSTVFCDRLRQPPRYYYYYYYYLIFFKNNGSPSAMTLFSKGPLHNTYKKTTKFTIATFTNYTTHKLRIKPRSVPKQGFKCI